MFVVCFAVDRPLRTAWGRGRGKTHAKAFENATKDLRSVSVGSDNVSQMLATWCRRKNLLYIPLAEEGTLFQSVEGRHNGTKVLIMKRSKGFGIRGSE